MVDGHKFKFKPNYNIKDRKALLRLLDKQDQQGLGGILLEDVEEALPRCEKALKVSSSPTPVSRNGSRLLPQSVTIVDTWYTKNTYLVINLCVSGVQKTTKYFKV